MAHKETNTLKGTDKGFAVSAAMVIVSAVLWGLYGTFVTILTSMGLERNALVFLRMLGTSLPVGLLICATDHSAFRVRRADIPLFICNGLFSLLFFTFCYTAAIKVTKIATAAALLYTAPAIVMVLSAVLFHERMNARKVFCCLLAVSPSRDAHSRPAWAGSCLQAVSYPDLLDLLDPPHPLPLQTVR